MKRIFALLLLALSLNTYAGGAHEPGLVPAPEPASAPSTNRWDGSQVQHFTLSGITGVIVSDVFKDRPTWQQFGIAMVPGVIKELGDGKWSSKDMLANALGAAAGLYLGPVMIRHSRGETTIAVAVQW